MQLSRWVVLCGCVDQLQVTDPIETLIENSQHYTTWDRADILKICKSSIETHLHHGYVNCFDAWVPH